MTLVKFGKRKNRVRHIGMRQVLAAHHNSRLDQEEMRSCIMWKITIEVSITRIHLSCEKTPLDLHLLTEIDHSTIAQNKNRHLPALKAKQKAGQVSRIWQQSN